MANFVRGNPSNWGFNEKLTSAEQNLTDAQWPDAVNGGGGGTYTPAALLSFLGANGILFNCALTFGSGHNPVSNAPNFIFDNSSPVIRNGGILAIEATAGTSHIHSSVVFDTGNFIYDTTTNEVDFKCPVVHTGAFVAYDTTSTLDIHAACTFAADGTVTFNTPNVVFDNSSAVIQNGGTLYLAATAGTSHVHSPWVFDADGTVTFNTPNVVFDNASPVIKNGGVISLEATAADSPVASVWKYTGAGHAKHRLTLGANANAVIGIHTCDYYYVPVGTLSANRTVTVLNTGCSAAGGEVIDIIHADCVSGKTLTIYEADGSTVIAVLGGGLNPRERIQIINDGSASASSAWHFIDFTGF